MKEIGRGKRCGLPIYAASGRCLLHTPKAHPSRGAELSAVDEPTVASQFRELFDLVTQEGSKTFFGIEFPPFNEKGNTLNSLRANQEIQLELRYCIFHGPMELPSSIVTASVFENCLFLDAVSFVGAEIRNTSFRSSIFEGPFDCRGAKIRHNTSFEECQFWGDVDFSGCRTADAFTISGSRYNPVFYSAVDFRGLRLQDSESRFTLREVSLERAQFGGVDLERIKFASVRWASKSSRVGFLFNLTRKVLSEEEQAIGDSTPGRLELVSDSYRQLVLNSERVRRFDLAEEFHLSEMEMRRQAALLGMGWWRPTFRFVNGYSLYRFSSHYGASYGQAAAVLLLYLLATAGVLLLLGIGTSATTSHRAIIDYDLWRPKGNEWVSPAQLARDFGAALTHTLAILSFQRQTRYQPLTDWGYLVQYAASIVLAAQSALLLLAIRRRFKR